MRTSKAGEVLARAVVEEVVDLAGVETEAEAGGGDEDVRFEGEGDWDGARRRWRSRSVASEGVRTGRVDQDVAVEREVVERAGEEAVKVAYEVVSVVDVDGDAVEGCSVGFEGGGCEASVVGGVLFSDSSSSFSVAPATACSRGSSGVSVPVIVSSASSCASRSDSYIFPD